MRILVNALSGIGDALMFSPSLKLLCNKLPNYHIDMMVMFKSVSELYKSNPYVSKIYFIDFLKQTKLKSISQLMEMRKKDYFISINVYPSNRVEYNIVNRVIGANKRLGHRYTKSSFLRGEFLNNISVNEEPNMHNVLQNTRLISKIIDFEEDEVGPLEIFLSEDDENLAKLYLQKQGIDFQSPIIGFHAGSSVLKNHINKRWDKKKFAELGLKLIKDYNANILLFGDEKGLNDEIKGLIGGKVHIVLFPTYIESMACLKLCNLMITNDTAFLHSAAALGVPVAAIFGYTNFRELYPWKTKHIIVRKDLDCSPCFFNSPKYAKCRWKGKESFKCIKIIETEEVYSACRGLLS
jgi:heptosyltransferase II